jgi:hypothetical protein
MIYGCAVAGDIVKHADGRVGLLTAWTGEGDAREVGVVMRNGLDGTFQRRWFPMKTFTAEFTMVGKIEEIGR